MTSAVTSAVSHDALEIPLIDFSTFLSPTSSPSLKLSTAQAVLSGFQRAGFIYLKNHGIPKSEITSTFASSAQFFKRSRAEKDALAWTTPEANRGYSQPGREKTTDLTSADEIEAKRAEEGADLKESFEIGLEGAEDYENQWPSQEEEEGRAFKQQMLGFFEQCKELHCQVMRAIAVGLGIEEGWFDGFVGKGDNTLRLLHYPEVRSEAFRENKSTVRAGAHTDYGEFCRCSHFQRDSVDGVTIGSITLLFQDMSGGLQVLSPNGNFVDATPIADTIVVNAADLLARWSNDMIKSTKHRVVEPPTHADVHPARYSIAYFCNPNFDAWIESIPGTYGAERERKYEGITR